MRPGSGCVFVIAISRLSNTRGAFGSIIKLTFLISGAIGIHESASRRQAEKEQADATSTSLTILWRILIDVIIYGMTRVRESTRVGRTCVDKR